MSILVSLISEFQDRGFRNASKQAGALTKTFKRLAVALGSALSFRQISRFAKVSVKAFLDDNKAASSLAKTLENVGLGFESTNIEAFIKSSQMAAAVSDDYLRPAMQDLLRATKSASEAQNLLNLALDISAGTGKDLRSVTTALSRAYLGNNTSLSRLNAGLDKAFLKTASFEEITAQLTSLFNGNAKKAANTYRGRLDKLEIAADEARETIGEGLVKAIEILGEGKGIEIAQKKMEGFATFVSNLSVGLAIIARDANKGTGGAFSGLGELIGDLTLFNQLNKDLATIVGREMSAQNTFQAKNLSHVKELAKLAKYVKKQEEGTTQQLDKASKLRKEQAQLKKAESVLDLEKIQIEAALQGDITENEKLRLQLMKAILNENADRATSLADKLSKSQEDLTKFKREAYDFKPENPFDAWLVAIEAMRKGLASIGAPVTTIPGASSMAGGGSALSVMPNIPEMSVFGGAGFITPELATRNPTGVTQINVNVQGTGGLDDQTKKAVVDAVVEASSYGNPTNWFRTTGKAVIAI
jgi:hypothetical protein